MRDLDAGVWYEWSLVGLLEPPAHLVTTDGTHWGFAIAHPNGHIAMGSPQNTPFVPSHFFLVPPPPSAGESVQVDTEADHWREGVDP